MSTMMLIAIGIFVFGFVIMALCGILGSLEAIDFQNQLARERKEREEKKND
jgi:predicted RND superfamily exporter protein